MISQSNVFKCISFHKSCKCDCLLDKNVCNNKQKWNKEKRRCECLKKKRCCNNYFFNVINCSCQMKKAAALIVEECKEIIDDVKENKTATSIGYIENCKPFVASSVLFVCVSIITTAIVIYFYCKLRNNSVLPF